MLLRAYIFSIIFLISACAKSQDKEKNVRHIGGPCEGCEAIYEYGNNTLHPVDTLPDFEKGKEKIKITGIIYKKDGKTPAKDVILYAYQTNEKGIYPKIKTSLGWEKRHGYIRGWIKTDASGKYTFYTFRPGSYPNSSIAQHIHFTIKEPDKNEYYIDDILFDDDPFLAEAMRKKSHPRCGNGIVTLIKKDSILEAKRDIILGLNIPDYY
ncbi:MAG: intradiol ring-cleavage dioxygenase [Aureibaculum sp.]